MIKKTKKKHGRKLIKYKRKERKNYEKENNSSKEIQQKFSEFSGRYIHSLISRFSLHELSRTKYYLLKRKLKSDVRLDF